jgi:hypothetical protein
MYKWHDQENVFGSDFDAPCSTRLYVHRYISAHERQTTSCPVRPLRSPFEIRYMRPNNQKRGKSLIVQHPNQAHHVDKTKQKLCAFNKRAPCTPLGPRKW